MSDSKAQRVTGPLAFKTSSLNSYIVLTRIFRRCFLWDLGKQNSPRCDGYSVAPISFFEK